MLDQLFEKKINCSDTETAANLFFLSAKKHSEKTALEWYDPHQNRVAKVTYEGLFSEVMALGSELYERDLKGKRVAMIGEKSYGWVLLFLTLLCSDTVVLPLDPRLDKEELIERLRFCDIDVCFADEGHPFFVTGEGIHGLSMYKISDVISLAAEGRQKVEGGDLSWVEDEISEESSFLMLYTSGTGGTMKVAVIRQKNFTLERFVWEDLRLYESKILITLPLYHIAGIAELRGALFVGTTAYLSRGVKNLLSEYAYVKPKAAFLVPTQALLLYEIISGKEKNAARKLLGDNLTVIRSTGAPLPKNIRDKFKEYDITVTSDYGMTETGGPVSVSVTRDGKIFSKEGSVGHILDRLDVKVDDPDENGYGEILVAGQCVFEGYYKNKKETDAIVYDGYLHTGDIGYIDEERFLFIVGRKKNVIILGSGENVVPEELEKLIYSIADVEECLVYEKDYAIAARIFCQDETKHASIKEKIDRLNATLPTYKGIGIVEFVTEPLPKTANGKIRRV